MCALQITRDPVVLSYLLTEELYAVNDPATPPTAPDSREAPAEPAASEGATGTAPENPKAASEAPGQAETYRYLGENKRQVLVLVYYPGEEYLPEAEKAYLEKILAAAGLRPDDIALLNYARYKEHRFPALKRFFNFRHLLLFGITPGRLDIPAAVSLYCTADTEGARILAADSPETLRPDTQKRRLLWAELQKLFL